MASSCKHPSTYKAEGVDIDGVTKHYYRCTECDIIISGPS